MLQRIQSIYLLLASLAMLCLLFIPYWSTTSGDKEIQYTALQLRLSATDANPVYLNLSDNVFLLGFGILSIISVVIGLILIFMYNNRLKQAFYTGLFILLQVLTGIAGYWVVYSMEGQLAMEGATDVASEAGTGVVFPLVALLSTWMARRSILKDEAKVRAMDRIR